jgi:hypothetical protein
VDATASKRRRDRVPLRAVAYQNDARWETDHPFARAASVKRVVTDSPVAAI